MTFSSEKFCLKWNAFQQNIVTAYQDLHKQLDFSDVTLVCEEDYQVEAHRVILTACSPFFKSMLKKNQHSHPMVYMRGLKAKDLVAIVDFIYHGEANVCQEDLDGFLALAEELQLKGLAGSQNDMEDSTGEPTKQELLKEVINNETLNRPRPKQTKAVKNVRQFGEQTKDSIYEIVSADSGKVLVNANMQDIKVQINSMMEKVIEGEYKWKCTVCGKMSKDKQDTSRHIETHIEGVSYPCNLCEAEKR